MTCESCHEPITFLDPQTSRGHAHWHTFCWNAAQSERLQHIEEMDNLDCFMTRHAPPDGCRPALPEEPGPKPVRSEETKNDMATASQRSPREVVDFPPNIPVTVALKYGQGKTISSQYGERIMYSLVDGRVMFLDLVTASQIEQLAINVRESFAITRHPGQNGTPATWEVARLAGEQPNGTFVVPAADTPTPKPPASAVTSGTPHKQSGRTLADEANALVDCFAQVLERSLTLYQGRIKPDEVKALLVTAYIQRRQLSSAA